MIKGFKKNGAVLDIVFDAYQKSIIDHLMEAMKIGNGQFSQYEIMITYPAVNLYLHYLGGVKIALENKNFIVALSSLRGAIESLATIVYDGTAHLTQEEYKKFYKKGRFYRKNVDGKWEEVGQRQLIKHMRVYTDLNALKMYDFCCSYLHFSNKHSGFMVNEVLENHQMRIKIGMDSNIPIHLQKEVIEFCSELSIVMVRTLQGLINERKGRFETMSPQQLVKDHQ